MSVKDFELDKTDELILKELQEDGRISYRTIAEKLDISDGTVRVRVNRMMESGFLKVSALIDPFFFKKQYRRPYRNDAREPDAPGDDAEDFGS